MMLRLTDFIHPPRLLTPACGTRWLATLVLFTAWICASTSSMAAARRYAPEKSFDVKHLRLEITPDFTSRTVEGTATLRLAPVMQPLRVMQLDAVDLRIHNLEADFGVQNWQVTPDRIEITFTEPVPLDREVLLTIRYDCQPEQGLFFRTPEMGYLEGEAHLFTQGETINHRHWFPCFDEPNDRFTTEMVCHVPAGMTALSNGRLLKTTDNPDSGLTTFHWLQDKTHVNYLVALVVGPFEKVAGLHRDVPLGFYVLPSEFEQAANSFEGTADMMAFFEEEIGVPYPWDRYDQVCVNDFVAGGMENTSLTILTDSTLFSQQTENIRSSLGLVAHELAHQWFGDLVTCKDWGHIWLNESFATYYDTLYNGHRHGEEEMRYELLERRRSLLAQAGDTRPIMRRDYGAAMEMFNHLTYPKGSWVLHMLRSQLGASLYRECIRTYVQRYQFGNVVTEDLNRVLEEVTGRSWDQFLDQWIYHGGYPDLEIRYNWDDVAGAAIVTVKQRQEVNDQVLLFNLPLKMRFKGEDFTVDQPLRIDAREHTFTVSLPGKPEAVLADPDVELLAKLSLDRPQAMVESMLQDRDNLSARLEAAELLGKRSDNRTIELLGIALRDDPHYGVRIQASKSLRAIHNTKSLQELLASRDQPDARARLQVVRDLGDFYREEALAALLEVVGTESNPAIVAAALDGLAGHRGESIAPAIKQQLHHQSYEDEICRAAMSAARKHRDPVVLEAILDRLKGDHMETSARTTALDSLAVLAAEGPQEEEILNLLLDHLDDPSEKIQRAALRGLGTLGNEKALPVLERYTAGETKDAAQSAIQAIRDRRPVSPELQQLRDEVQTLRREQQELREKIQ